MNITYVPLPDSNGRARARLREPHGASRRARQLGLPIERDLHFEADKPISAYADEARTHGHIVI
jgi:hypothetical protein